MKYSVFSSVAVAFALAAASGVAAYGADEIDGNINGHGMSAEKGVQPALAPSVSPKPQDEFNSVEPAPLASDDRILGVVTNIVIVGDKECARKYALEEILKKELGDEIQSKRTLLRALKSAKYEIIEKRKEAEGEEAAGDVRICGVGDMGLDGGDGRRLETYDEKTKTLTVSFRANKLMGSVERVEFAGAVAYVNDNLVSTTNLEAAIFEKLAGTSVGATLPEAERHKAAKAFAATNSFNLFELEDAISAAAKKIVSETGRNYIVFACGEGGVESAYDKKTKTLRPQLKLTFEEVVSAGDKPRVTIKCMRDTRKFVETHGLADKVREAYLCAAGKTESAKAEVAIEVIKEQLRKEGYFLCGFSKRRSYDKRTDALTAFFDDGKFGDFVRIKKVVHEPCLFGLVSGWTNEVDVATGEVAADVDRWFSRAQVEEKFGKIKKGDTFNYKILRDALVRVNENPDLQMDVAIKATNTVVNTDSKWNIRKSDIEFMLKEELPVHGMIEINNFGMEDIEEWQFAATLQHTNLTKHDDVLTLSPSISMGAELKSLAGSYMLPHKWWHGGNTTVYGGWSDLDVNGIVPRLDLEGSGWFAGLQHSEALVDRDSDHLWTLSAGVLWRYMEDQYTAYGRIRLNERGASIIPLSLALSYTQRNTDWFGGRNFFTLQGVYNLATGGDDLADMWTDADEHYWILRGQLAHLQPLPFSWLPLTKQSGNEWQRQWMLFFKLEGQYTSNILVPVEKLSLGGYNTMRGYRARGYIGDYGVYGTLELRSPILLDGISSLFGRNNDVETLDRLQFLLFTDCGWTAFNDLPAGYDDNEFLFSAGVGLRAAITRYLQARLDIAFPLKNAYGDDDSMEVYLSVQTQF